MSKFKLSTKSPAAQIAGTGAADHPDTPEAFAAGAAMVQSQAGGRPPKPVRVNFDLVPELHRRLKMRAVTEGKTVAELVRHWIEVQLDK